VNSPRNHAGAKKIKQATSRNLSDEGSGPPSFVLRVFVVLVSRIYQFASRMMQMVHFRKHVSSLHLHPKRGMNNNPLVSDACGE
jgi:hypothetical protein